MSPTCGSRKRCAGWGSAAGSVWNARYLKLAVYDDNPSGRAFYDRLGFAPTEGETTLSLGRAAFDALKGLT